MMTTACPPEEPFCVFPSKVVPVKEVPRLPALQGQSMILNMRPFIVTIQQERVQFTAVALTRKYLKHFSDTLSHILASHGKFRDRVNLVTLFKFLSKPSVSQKNVDQRCCYVWNDCLFLGKRGMTFGQRTVDANEYHILQVGRIPLIYYKRTEPAADQESEFFLEDQRHFSEQSLGPRIAYKIPPSTTYILLCCDRTYFSLHRVSVEDPLPEWVQDIPLKKRKRKRTYRRPPTEESVRSTPTIDPGTQTPAAEVTQPPPPTAEPVAQTPSYQDQLQMLANMSDLYRRTSEAQRTSVISSPNLRRVIHRTPSKKACPENPLDLRSTLPTNETPFSSSFLNLFQFSPARGDPLPLPHDPLASTFPSANLFSPADQEVPLGSTDLPVNPMMVQHHSVSFLQTPSFLQMPSPYRHLETQALPAWRTLGTPDMSNVADLNP